MRVLMPICASAGGFKFNKYTISQQEYAMANIAKRKTSNKLKTLLCDNSLHDIQVFERGKDQIIYSCVYRYAGIILAEDMIPSPDQNGNYIDIDIGDHWWTNDVLIDYWELKIKDRAPQEKGKSFVVQRR
jgi:hypothetical protein